MDVCIGDRVQIVNGGMDVTNGLRAKEGKSYGEGGPLWATVSLIDTDWKTDSKYGLPSTVTKVRCVSDNGIIVWQVQPQDIASNIIHGSQPELVQTEVKKEDIPEPGHSSNTDVASVGTSSARKQVMVDEKMSASLYGYAPQYLSTSWASGGRVSTAASALNEVGDPIGDTVQLDAYPFTKENIATPTKNLGGFRPLNDQEKTVIGAVSNLEVNETALHGTAFPTAWSDPDKRAVMLNEKPSEIQNSQGFPYALNHNGKSRNLTRPYDFQIIPGDKRYASTKSMEDLLRDFRASVGLPVHGDNDLARAMKYYMYNRFKVPDTNLAHNKTVTHVFFSRPDLNLLSGGSPVTQIANHTEAAMIWRRYPELLKLLTDCRRCGDSDNFNWLLSNQVESFDIKDEELSTIEAGKSWNEYTMPYGDGYTGRTGGDFGCTFVETSDYSIINLIKLWVTYIDNVSRGAWSPSYNLYGMGQDSLMSSHVFTKTLDYAASAYVFKCGGGHGEDVLYWSKYYGVFPISTGAGALSWNASDSIGNAPKLSIRFRYAWKKDLSPVSLLEFNNLGLIYGSQVSESAYDRRVAGSSRPFVGVPFIEIDRHEPSLRGGGASIGQPRTTIRMKFKKTGDAILNDNNLFRSTVISRT